MSYGPHVVTRATVIRPGLYVVGLEKDDLKVLVKAIADWTGPLGGRAPMTPAEGEDAKDQIRRAAALVTAFQQALE